MGTENEGFHRRSKRGDFGKSKFSGLGGVLETSFGSTTLQEVEILHTLVYFHHKGLILGGMLCRGPKGMFSLFRNCLNLFLWLICGLVWLLS